MPIVYATFEDMRARFSDADLMQLADVAAIGDAQTYVDQKIAKAGAIIDGYVSAFYGDRSELPVPALLTECACDLAYYALFRREPTDKARDDRTAAIATLRDIAKGTIKIDGGVIDAQPARPGAVLVAGNERLFGRGSLDGF
ncbi:MAG TPA: phage protein Gp36 family protein [Sphingobium sp.]